MTKRLNLLPLTMMGVAALVCVSPASAAMIVAGIDTWDSVSAPTVGVTATDVTAAATASTSSGNWSNSDNGGDPGRGSSGDTTWGTFDGNGVAADATTSGSGLNFTALNAVTEAEVTLRITNNGSADVVLETFHMDALAFRPKAPRTYALNVLAGSDITVGNVFTSGLPMSDNSTDAITHLGGGLSGHDQHDDIDLGLTGLADNTLAAGESAIIQIAFSNGVGDNSGGHHLFLDNVAISGTVIPEPATLSLLALAGIGVLARRRK